MLKDPAGHDDYARVSYTPISETNKQISTEIKLAVNELIQTMNNLQEAQTAPEVRRLIALSITEFENGSMWAVKALTSEAFI